MYGIQNKIYLTPYFLLEFSPSLKKADYSLLLKIIHNHKYQ